MDTPKWNRNTLGEIFERNAEFVYDIIESQKDAEYLGSGMYVNKQDEPEIHIIFNEATRDKVDLKAIPEAAPDGTKIVVEFRGPARLL